MNLAALPDSLPPDTLVVLIVGASGRLGRFLAREWGRYPPAGVAPVWQFRRAGESEAGRNILLWDPLASPIPGALRGRVDVVLCLAGVVAGSAAALACNTDLALAALRAARDLGARHVFLSSSVAVYGAVPGARSEAAPMSPVSAYGRAKRDMEVAAQDWRRAAAAQMSERQVPEQQVPGLTVLRIGNVPGADALLGATGLHGKAPGDMQKGIQAGAPVLLDRFADGQGPRRSYIGPVTLAAVLARLVRLAGQGAPLPPTLNVAAPGLVAMQALLDAAGLPWRWRPAPTGALPVQELDVAWLGRLFAFASGAADPVRLVAEWRSLAEPVSVESMKPGPMKSEVS